MIVSTSEADANAEPGVEETREADGQSGGQYVAYSETQTETDVQTQQSMTGTALLAVRV